jgi:hypothetical protein
MFSDSLGPLISVNYRESVAERRKIVDRKVFVSDVRASNRATPTLLDTQRPLAHKGLFTLIYPNPFDALGMQ